MSASAAVKEVGSKDFATEVIERSKTVPVVVDFWAPWCGPCRVLGPIIEAEVGALGGRAELVKVNTDENPELAHEYGIQGIPAVKAFRDGKVVSEFVGAIPAPQIQRFLKQLVPAPGVAALEKAEADAKAGRTAEAETALRSLTGDGEVKDRAQLALARLLVDAGRAEEAMAAIAQIDERSPQALELPPLERRLRLHRRRRRLRGRGTRPGPRWTRTPATSKPATRWPAPSRPADRARNPWITSSPSPRRTGNSRTTAPAWPCWPSSTSSAETTSSPRTTAAACKSSSKGVRSPRPPTPDRWPPRRRVALAPRLRGERVREGSAAHAPLPLATATPGCPRPASSRGEGQGEGSAAHAPLPLATATPGFPRPASARGEGQGEGPLAASRGCPASPCGRSLAPACRCARRCGRRRRPAAPGSGSAAAGRSGSCRSRPGWRSSPAPGCRG